MTTEKQSFRPVCVWGVYGFRHEPRSGANPPPSWGPRAMCLAAAADRWLGMLGTLGTVPAVPDGRSGCARAWVRRPAPSTRRRHTDSPECNAMGWTLAIIGLYNTASGEPSTRKGRSAILGYYMKNLSPLPHPPSPVPHPPSPNAHYVSYTTTPSVLYALPTKSHL